ncbi:MAG: iron donor protein CyaY [Granulicella sp.]
MSRERLIGNRTCNLLPPQPLTAIISQYPSSTLTHMSLMDESTFRRESDRALESLKQSLIAAEDDSGSFEFEDNNGVMNIIFENGSSKFVVTPNTPVRQVWISAQATSFKLEWDETTGTFVLAKTGEALTPLMERLLRDHLGDPGITLK